MTVLETINKGVGVLASQVNMPLKTVVDIGYPFSVVNSLMAEVARTVIEQRINWLVVAAVYIRQGLSPANLGSITTHRESLSRLLKGADAGRELLNGLRRLLI